MIETFEGRIGGGKTLSAMQRMFMLWSNGGRVFTNVDVKWTECKEYAVRRLGLELDDQQLGILSDEQIARFWEHTPAGTRELPVLVVIDEADVWLGNQCQGVKVEPAMFNFLKQSRKMGTDVIFITQALKNLATGVARLNQHVWRFRDMEKWRIKELGITWPFPQVLQVCYDYNGKTILHQRYWTKDKDLFQCYNTNALYAPFNRLQEHEVKIQVKRLKKKQVEVPTWAFVAALAVLVLIAIL